MPCRLTPFILLLSACASEADDLNYGAPSAVDFGDLGPTFVEAPPIQLGLPDSYTGDVVSDVTEPSDDIDMDTGPAETSDNCANDVIIGGQILCL